MMNVAFVPVRGGSKSIPKKNIKLFCGHPLVFWSLQALQYSNSIDRIVIATNDYEIEDTVKDFRFGKVEFFRRSEEHAQDHSKTEDVMLEYIKNSSLKPEDHFILVQATNPFSIASDFDNALKQLKTSGKESLLSCARIKRFFWTNEGQPLNYDYRKRPRRQDFDGQLVENGAFYINQVKNIIKH